MMRRQRTIACRHCGQVLTLRQTRCSACGHVTEYGRQFYLNLGVRLLLVAAGFVFVFLQLPKILAALSAP